MFGKLIMKGSVGYEKNVNGENWGDSVNPFSGDFYTHLYPY